MARLFKSPTSTVANHRSQLNSYWDDELSKPKVKFNINEPAHLMLIGECTKTLVHKLEKLQAIDTRIVGAFSLGVAALALSWILPVGLLAVAAFAYGAYKMSERQNAYAEYTQALENEAACCAWSLGDVPGNDVKYLENPVLKPMVTALGHVMNHVQLKKLIDDDIEDVAINQSDKAQKNDEDFIPGLPREEQKNLFYKIYGYEQGSFLNILQGSAYAIQAGWRALTGNANPEVRPDHIPQQSV